jgi:hypothetical protein
MRSKPFLLSLLIVLPLVIIAFLYLFGKNEYKIEPKSQLRNITLTNLYKVLDKQPIATLVSLSSSDTRIDNLTTRVVGRVLRLRKEGGKIRLVYLMPESLLNTRNPENVDYLPYTQSDFETILSKDFHFPDDTGGMGFWYLLLDKNGKLVNAYDLRQERLLDTLAIETTILATE